MSALVSSNVGCIEGDALVCTVVYMRGRTGADSWEGVRRTLTGDRRTMEIAQAVLIFVCEVSPREVHGS